MPKKRVPQAKPSNPAPRGQQLPALYRFVPQFASPQWQNANAWRRVVRQQPVAIACRDTLISFLIGTDWQIRAKDPDQTEAYTNDIDYYTELFENLNGWDFNSFLDVLCQDMLDTPFGGAAEIGRLGDDPDGRTVWTQHLDSATLYPTLDFEYPVAQRIPEVAHPPVLFPRHAIGRALYTPRPEYDRQGWGMAPPEKIYLAIELLYRGDRYYANMLLDTPEAGILDLMDMEKKAALEWLESFQQMFSGIDPFKVPVLYEHTTKAEWIPFGRPPTDLIYDSVTFKYAQIICAGYGLKISDLGLSQDQSTTLAGVIRAERQTRRTGFAVIAEKTYGFFNKLLPTHLLFEWVDSDDESMLSRGRARLANFQAYAEAREKRMLTLQEVRAQIAADGLMDIQIDPDDPEALAMDDMMMGPDTVRLPRTSDRDRVPPSKGGEGEHTFPRKSMTDLITVTMTAPIREVNELRLRRLIKMMARKAFPGIKAAFKSIDANDLDAWLIAALQDAFDNDKLKTQKATLTKHLKADDWWSLKRYITGEEFESAVNQAYSSGLSECANHVSELLYEEGKVDILEKVSIDSSLPPKTYSTVGLVDDVDNQTQGLIKSGVLAAIYMAFSMPTVYQSVRDGIKIEELLAERQLMDKMIEELFPIIEEAYKSRITILSDVLYDSIIERAATDYFGSIKLKKGDWISEDGKISVSTGPLLKIASKKNFQIWRNDD